MTEAALPLNLQHCYASCLRAFAVSLISGSPDLLMECKVLDCWSVRRAGQSDCKRFITNRGDVVSAGLSGTHSPRLVMKRLQSNCQARRIDQQLISAPELPIFHNIARFLSNLSVTIAEFRTLPISYSILQLNVDKLFWEVRQMNVLHQAASCSSCYDIRDIAIHVCTQHTTHKVAENYSTAHGRLRPPSSGSSVCATALTTKQSAVLETIRAPPYS
ncbi:hypothetical protein CSKR_113017 [Clonorchis sinensis]|uniref:Uncharacterized protein n=1 Tax=Clonorchis sinensis TaxID=79923 RepID=A0A3R7D7Z0_CLOSI|nr:hypothetical protein CSKR_113017 [Clonorchis sinensis]